MKTFKDLEFNNHPNWDGVQARMDFDNNYGVSVIKASGSYGGSQGLYELAVMYEGDLCYNTDVTDDVLGWLSEEDVTEAMEKVQKLKP
jgi:hypothetical protein